MACNGFCLSELQQWCFLLVHLSAANGIEYHLIQCNLPGQHIMDCMCLCCFDSGIPIQQPQSGTTLCRRFVTLLVVLLLYLLLASCSCS